MSRKRVEHLIPEHENWEKSILLKYLKIGQNFEK
jgi:hypothetical protein